MPAPVLHPLTLEDRSWFEALLRAHRASRDPLAAYSFPYHFIWRDLFRYEWGEWEGHRGLVASNPDGSFLALPPIGPDPCGPAMAWAFAFLAESNRNPAVSRIENVPETLTARCREQGYRVANKSPDYLYRRADLVGLQGDRYKGQRVSYNHCLKHAHPEYRIFQSHDLEACWALFREWREEIGKTGGDDLARHLAADAESAHRFALSHAADLGLTGRVVEVDGRVVAYTFGYPLTSSVFCVLLEIADRKIKGLAQFIFREFCRDLESYEFINTMDDSGLDGLRRAKLAYHPVRLVESYIISPV